MNDSDFETHLRALRPAAPAPVLEQRVARALTEAPLASPPAAGVLTRPNPGRRVGRWLRDLGWAMVGATAALAALALLYQRTGPLAEQSPIAVPAAETAGPDAAGTFEHASASEELVAAQDSAEIIETEEGLVRTVRYSYRERHAWANPRTGARMEIEVPREDVYLIPVSLQ